MVFFWFCFLWGNYIIGIFCKTLLSIKTKPQRKSQIPEQPCMILCYINDGAVLQPPGAGKWGTGSSSGVSGEFITGNSDSSRGRFK